MKCVLPARPLILALLIAYLPLLSACSYSTDFVVVNESTQPIEIRYQVKKSPAGPLAISGIPATIEAFQLSPHGGQAWKELTADQYKVLEEDSNETVAVRIAPHEAVRLTRLLEYGGHADPGEANHFPIEKIDIKGATGELKLEGQSARTSFSEVSRALYTLTYK